MRAEGATLVLRNRISNGRGWRLEGGSRAIAGQLPAPSPWGLFSITLLAAVAALPLTELRVAPQLTFSDLLFALAALIGIAGGQIRTRGGGAGLAGWLTLSAWLVSVLVVASSYFAQSPTESAINAVKVGFAVAVVGGVSLKATEDLGMASPMMWAYSVGAAVAAVSGVVALGAGQASQVGSIERAAGLGGHPVGLAISCGVGMAASYYFSDSRLHQKVLRLFLLAANAAGVIVAVGMTGLGAAIIGVLVAFPFAVSPQWKTRRLRELGAGALLVAVVGIPAGFAGALGGRVSDFVAELTGGGVSAEGREATLAMRWDTWSASLGRIATHPLAGNGFDDAGQLAVGNTATHNFVLLSWQAGGLLMLAVALSSLLASVWAVRRLWLARRVLDVSSVVAVIVSAWVAALLSPTLYARAHYFFVFVSVGLARLVARDISTLSSRQPFVRPRSETPNLRRKSPLHETSGMAGLR